MILVISPAKSLDYTTPVASVPFTQPDFLDDAERLVGQLRQLSPAALAGLMGISDPLAALNAVRYAEWSRPFTPENARPAVLAFDGDVYDGLSARTLSADDLAFAQRHLRILSGLYGVLRPLDLMQPYRLEMGTRLANARGRDLYAFWGERVARTLADAARSVGAGTLVNLASEEYFKAVRPAALALPLIQPVFEDWGGGRFRVASFHAKRARGMMARFAVRARLRSPESLQAFTEGGYAFAPEASDATRWVFRRRAA